MVLISGDPLREGESRGGQKRWRPSASALASIEQVPEQEITLADACEAATPEAGLGAVAVAE